MEMALSPEVQKRIKEKLHAGQFKSAEHLIQCALDALDCLDEDSQVKLERLRALVKVGTDQLDRGEGEPWDFDSLRERLRDRYARRQRRPA